MSSHMKKKPSYFSFPARTIALSFAAVILTGTLLLMLPVSSRERVFSPFLDCLFTATSATCVTGLVVYDTYTHWSAFGHCVILSLIQVGGLGLVTLASFFSVMIGKKLGLRQLHTAQESVASIDGDVSTLLKVVILTSLVVEGAGALLLMAVFVPDFGAYGVFMAVFTSVSAFCNAGFDLLGCVEPYCSLVYYNDNPLALGTIGALIIIGGIGFIVIFDLLRYRQTRKLTLHTRVVLVATAILILAGTALIAVCEWDNPETLGALPSTAQKLGASWFHSVTCRTAGFNSISISGLRDIGKIISSVLMFIGAAPGSTGGGIKCTTAAVIFMTVYSVIRGDEDTTIFRRRVEKGAVYKSLAVFMLAMVAVFVTAGCIMATMQHTHAVTGPDALLESVSAFATVGLSAGVSGVANPLVKGLLIFLMYIGRLGPVSFLLSLAMRAQSNRRAVVPDGKIQIG